MQFHKPEWHDRLSSTNTVLMERVRSGKDVPSGWVLAAREQTAGRGRYDRTWVGQMGKNLTFSFLLVTRAEFPRLSSLPMAVALGTASALEAFEIDAQVKWPNDVLVGGGKICGILSEWCDLPHPAGNRVVVGVGLNVNMEGNEAALIERPATSMRIETGRTYEVEAVLEKVLEVLPGWLMRWEADGFSAIRKGWMERCCLVGERVAVGEGEDRREGVLKGFGGEGQMLLRGDQGEVQEVWTGDVAGL